MPLSVEEKNALIDEVGSQVVGKAESVINESTKEIQEKLKGLSDGNKLTEEQYKELKDTQEKYNEKLEKTLKDQGTSITELKETISKNELTGDSIAQKLEKDKEDLKKIYSQSGVGAKSYMLTIGADNKPVLKDYVHGTVDAIETGSLASIAQNFDASSILRMGAGAQMQDLYRNTPYIFDLCNTVTTSIDQKLAMWMDELPVTGSSDTVVEGGTKPKVNYKYELQSDPYKKEAKLVSFTQEFDMDFGELEQRILENGRTDLINNINTKILPRIEAAASAYNTATEFKGGEVITSPHDFDVIAAMAAQAENATFGGVSVNAALVDTFKKWRMGVQRDNENNYLNAPNVLNGISVVGNPGVTTGNVTVGDFSQYNILLRGGIIVKVGYNGTDFAENKFSVVMEQFYYDYISSNRATALVSDTFANVKGLISA